MRKIKIIGKGLPQFQQQPGTITTTNKMDIPSLHIPVSPKFIPPPGYLQGMQMTGWTPPQQAPTVGIPAMPTYGQYMERQNQQQYPWAFSQAQKQQILNEQPQAKEKQQSNKLMTGPQLAALSVNMLSNVADKLQRAELQKQADEAARSTGQTDAKFPTMRNIYSRGRTPSGYSYSQMVPVQFAGAPAFQPMTFPQFAQDGIEVTRDILQMPSLYTSDPSAPGLYAQDPAIEEAMTRRYADINLPTADITGVLTSPAVGPTAAPTTVASSAMIGENLSLPLDPYAFKFSSGYGKRTAPKSGASTDHNGVDLAVGAGSNIYSIKPGTVYQKWFDKKGGNQLIIKHDDGTTSGYAHLENFAAKEGDRVNAGSVIGYVGSTGVATGPHLHFTYRDASGNRVDPTNIFDFKAYSRASKSSSATPGLSGQVSYTHNNPLNIHHGRFASNYGATKGAYDNSGNVAIFPDLNTGIQAAKDLLFAPTSSYYNLRISEARNRWVNGDADQPSESTKHIIKAMGKDVPISQLTAPEKDKLLKLFAKWEGKQGYNAIKDMPLFEEGGEYELDDDQIQQILANGGQVEFL